MRRHRLVFMSILAAVLLSLSAAACGDDDDDSDGGDDDAASLSFGREGAAATTTSSGERSKSAAAPSSGSANPDSSLSSVVDRKVIYNATLELQAEDVQFSFSSVQRLAREAGGFVDQSSLSFRDADGEDRAFATLRLRVPGDQYLDTLAKLRSLDGVKVSKEGSGSREVTEEYTDLQSRLRNLERTEAQYLELLKQAVTIDQILTVNDRINGVRAQIEQVVGRLNLLNSLTDFATIDVSLVPALLAAKVAEGGRASVGEVFVGAWEASLDVVRVLGYAAAVLAVAAIWLAIPGLVVLGVYYLHRRMTPA